MRVLLMTALVAFAGLLGSPAMAEHLASPSVPGFIVGYEAGNSQQSIREEVPAGETVEDWSRMVTTQRFTDVATRVTPLQFLRSIAQRLAGSCRAAVTSQPSSFVRNGRAASQMRADCPLVETTGKPETFIILVVAGSRDLHVKQVAFRRVPTDADTRWGEEILAAVVFCETGSRDQSCAG